MEIKKTHKNLAPATYHLAKANELLKEIDVEFALEINILQKKIIDKHLTD